MTNIHESVFIADGAKIVGDGITIDENSSVWFNAVLRCSGGATIKVGKRTNIQDLSLLHIGKGNSVSVGDDVTIGHCCIIHGCTIGNNTLIGMGSTIMNGAVIGDNCIIGAGSLVTEGKIIPDGSVAFGRPAKVVKDITPEQIQENRVSACWYMEEAAELKAER